MAHVNTLGWIVGFTLLGGVAGVSVASLFLLVPEKQRSRALPFMVAFATGALLAAALLGLLPEAVELAGPGGYGKVPVGPNYVGDNAVEDINGVRREYPQPSS